MSSVFSKGGVYEIVNTTHGKRYIGSTVDFNKRWRVHKHHLTQGTHHSRHLQFAWNKYGANVFRFNIVMLCPPGELLVWEQRYLDEFRPEYNMLRTAGSSLGTKQTPEHIENAHGWRRGVKTGPQSPEWIEKRIAPCRGKKQTPEWVEKRAGQLRGRKRPALSLEHRAKISASCKVHHASH